jgi:phosphoribosyl-dephospho-CoA transferase
MASRDPTATWSRHARVWLDATTWQRHLRGSIDEEPWALVADWIERGNALVARRRDAQAPADDCFLAIALPLRAGRARIAVVVGRDAVVRVDRPLRLDEVAAHAPDSRRAALDALERSGVAIGVVFRVYGSFAWQAICGEPCVTSRSDLDLLWDARDATQVAQVIDLLARWELDHGLRADGEARFPNGDAVAWRELGAATARVLVKREDGVALATSPLATMTVCA